MPYVEVLLEINEVPNTYGIVPPEFVRLNPFARNYLHLSTPDFQKGLIPEV
jgi:hypothetical protein